MPKRIEFGEVRLNDISKSHIMDCLNNSRITMGAKVQLFEDNWKRLFGYKFARAVSSGTSAGIACCLALYDFGAKEGDEVICPALSFIATASAVRAAGLKPVFVDIRRETLNIDEDLIEQAITPRTAAIQVVNTMGRPAELDKIKKIADKHGLKMIVDNCEAYGSKFKDRFALDFADMETSSHYAAHLICSAEGGTVSTNDPQIDEIIESNRSHGRILGSLYFDHIRRGLNLKMSDLHAAVGLGEIEHFWDTFWLRRQNVTKIREAVRGLEDIAWFTEEDAGNINCPHGFSITLKDKFKHKMGDLQSLLDQHSIHWKRNFGAIPTHRAFSDVQGHYPEAEYAGDYGLHVGCHQWLGDDLEYLCEKLKSALIDIGSQLPCR